MVDWLSVRRAGILLHVTSLPSSRLDDDALRWIDFIASAGLSVWQVLPLVIPDANGSPYQSPSAFAMNPGLLPSNDAKVNESEFEEYCAVEAAWLEDFALFEVLKQRFGDRAWVDWPDNFRNRDSTSPPVAMGTLNCTASAPCPSQLSA